MKAITITLVLFSVIATAVAPVHAGGCRRGTTTIVQSCPPSNGHSPLGDLALLDAICESRRDNDNGDAEEVLTTLLPVILQILQNPPAPPAGPTQQPNILLIPDGSAKTSYRVTATSNQIRVPVRLIPTVAKYAELKTKFAKQPSGRVVKYYELGQRKAVPVARSRYPRAQ